MNVDRTRPTPVLPGRHDPARPHDPRGVRSARMAAFILSASIIGSIPGCVPVPRGDDPLDIRFMTTDQLRDYSERVFRRQNSVTTRLMLAPPMADALSAAERSRIDKAETRMYETCASLNEIAAARASGRDVELKLENQVRKSVRSCAASTRRLERLLDRHGIGSGSLDPSGMGSPAPVDEEQGLRNLPGT